MWQTGLLGDLLPELSAHIDASGGAKSKVWKYLAVLDELDAVRRGEGGEVSNAVRAAALMTGLVRREKEPATSRAAMQTMMRTLKVPKATYFPAVSLLESTRRLCAPPARDKKRFVRGELFLDALDYNRIVLRAEGRDESVLEAWIQLYEQGGKDDEHT